ncbi:MAG: arginine--tRNA ligase [Clostridia bacterium]|nr:arginine--tRNA ligase [Clostridia bacterium]
MDMKGKLARALAGITGADAAELCEWMEAPKRRELGDYAFPCFRLARTLKQAPAAIAEELARAVALPDGISRAEAAGGYLNFFVDRQSFARDVLSRALDEREQYGRSTEGAGKTVCVEYSSINIAKPMHIGHLSTTVLGNSLKRIYDRLGYDTVSINHLGDWGTQFGKMIAAYKHWGAPELLETGGVRDLVALYIRFHAEAEAEPSLDDEARAWFRKIEQHDEEAWALFQRFKEITMKEADRVYALLGVEFDSYAGENFYEDKMQPVIDEIRAKGLATVDGGALIVDLSEYDMPPCIILKSDGGTIYATRDLAAACYRKATYDFHKLLYVVAYQQNLHFRQIFKVLELMGHDWVKDCVHVNFGMVSIEDGSLSTRKGNVVYLDDVLHAAIEKTRAVIEEKSPDLEDKDEVARQVGVGAVVWGTLYNSRIKDIVFSYAKALNFDGETGPYAQYTYARCCSVLRKASGYDLCAADMSALEDEFSGALIRAIHEFPEVVREAAEKYEPYLVARAVIAICAAFNRFYYEHRIMEDDPAVRNARLALTDAAKCAVGAGLSLLGIETPERM